MTLVEKRVEHSDPIHIICAADARYGAYAGIMISSVLAQNQPGCICCHLLDDGVQSKDLHRMARMARQAGATFDVYDIQQKLDQFPDVLKRMAHYSRTAFGRLFIPEFVPNTIDRMIYFDCDVICLSNLRELWDFGARVEILAAVRDEWVDQDAAHKLSIGMPIDAKYYNSGVLVFNLAGWRKRNLSVQLLDHLCSTARTLYADQDALNALVWPEITELPAKWNVLISSPKPGEAEQNLSNAANIHFCGGFKPWHVGYASSGGPAASTFRRAKAASPWRWKLPDFHLGRVKRKVNDFLAARFG